MSRFLTIVNGRPQGKAETASFFDSGWIAYEDINNSPSLDWHRLTLPSTFVEYPKMYTITFDNGTAVYPGDAASQLVFKLISGVYYIDVDLTKGIIGNPSFKVCAINF